MSLKELCRRWLDWPRRSRVVRRQTPRRRGLRLSLERLEDRSLPSSYTAATVSDLIANINAANLAGGPNTIALVAGTTYTLTVADNGADGANGLPVVAANDNLTILGSGDTIERSTATGTSAFRLFDVAVGGELTLANLTLQGGLALGSGVFPPAVSAEGGAIYSQGSLILNGVTVQNNTAQGKNGAGQSAAGGGIYSGGVLTLEDGTKVQNNRALGGVGSNGYSYSTMFATWGKRGGNAYGGGLCVAGGTATLTDTTLSSNTAQGGQGGNGVQGPRDPTSLSNPGVGHGGVGGNAVGGGLYAAAGSITLRNDSVTQNTTHGGTGGTGSPGGAAGLAEGGGLDINALATLYLDAFTLANLKANKPDNIYGSYTLIS